MPVKVSGFARAQKELRRAIRDIPLKSEQLVFSILTGISQHTRPYVPVDTSNLINSEVIRTTTSGDAAVGFLSYGGNVQGGGKLGAPVHYAHYVHEGPQRNWQKPGASNRYLLKGVKSFISEDLSNVIRQFGR